MAQHIYDICLVGGGLVGQTLALALAQQGFETILLDRNPPGALPKPDGRASALSSSTATLLEHLGIWNTLSAAAQPIRHIRVIDSDGPGILDLEPPAQDDTPQGYIIENAALEGALTSALAKLKGLKVAAPAQVSDIDYGLGFAAIHLADGEAVKARLVCAADGAASAVRDGANIDVQTKSYGQSAVTLTLAHSAPHHGLAFQRFLPSGPFAMLPMTGQRSSLVWTVKTAQAEALVAAPGALLLALIAKHADPYWGDFSLDGPRQSYPLRALQAERYFSSRLALVGDAAHVIHPLAGQGLNLGLRDVAALTQVLVEALRLGEDIGAVQVLERYGRWRRSDVLALFLATDGLNSIFSVSKGPLRKLRRKGLKMVQRSDPLKRFFVQQARGLGGDLPKLLTQEGL